jgi:hypothetical protein
MILDELLDSIREDFAVRSVPVGVRRVALMALEVA